MRASPDRFDQPTDPPAWEQWAAGFVVFMLTGALFAPVFAPDQSETPMLRFLWLPHVRAHRECLGELANLTGGGTIL